MAATTAFMAVVKTNHHATICAACGATKFELTVFLEPDELFTLPTGYVYSQVEERTLDNPLQGCPPFKTKKYYFTF